MPKDPAAAGGSLDAPPITRISAHWARTANLTRAGEISRLARRAELGEAQVWAVASAMRLTSDGLARMLRSAVTVRALGAMDGTALARDQQRSVTRLTELALEHAEPPGTARPVDAVSRSALFPAALYANTAPLDISGDKARAIFQNIDGQPTRTDPRRWFEFWSEQCALLGKMPSFGDLAGIVEGSLDDFNQKTILRTPTRPQAIKTQAFVPETLHDLHVAFFGTRTSTWGSSFFGQLGYSGETSLWAALMPFAEPHEKLYADKASLMQAVEHYGKAPWTPWSHDDRWATEVAPVLVNGDASAVENVLQQYFFFAGELTDPRVLAQVRGPIEVILTAAPGSASRIAAADTFKAVLENGPGRGGPGAGSVRAIWTEMVLVQVLCAYLEASGLASRYKRPGKVDASEVFDMGRAYRIYEDMQKRHALVTLDDVRAMLGRIGVPAK